MGAGTKRVRARGAGSVAVGGNLMGNAVGAGSTAGPQPEPAPVGIGGDLDVRADDGGVAVGGTMRGNALGGPGAAR